MPVNTICNHDVATVDASADMVEAARPMREGHVGDLINIAGAIRVERNKETETRP